MDVRAQISRVGSDHPLTYAMLFVLIYAYADTHADTDIDTHADVKILSFALCCSALDICVSVCVLNHVDPESYTH